MASVELRGVTKVHAGGVEALRDVSVGAADGELLVLVGPSGSGKSTVLRLIAGLDAPTSGRIFIGDRDVTVEPPQARDVAMVFQSYALYPHKSVRENLAFGLRVRGMDPGSIDERVRHAAATLDIAALLDRKPAQLSGGQRQRVALGRAIVRVPQAFLLDEPLSNLDPQLRLATRAELALLHRRLAATIVYVTHDQEEAMTLGTRVAVMREGRIEQMAPPLDVYERPANTFVAQFVGSPAMNVWPCELLEGRLTSAAFSLALDSKLPSEPPGPLLVGVRPHDVEVTDGRDGDLRGRVAVVESLGMATIVHVRIDGLPELARAVVAPERRPTVGEAVGLRPRPDRLHIFDAHTGKRIAGDR